MTTKFNEYGWVIEAQGQSALLYWDGGKWSTNNLRAVCFSRQVDAERVMINIRSDEREAGMRSSEHAWIVHASDCATHNAPALPVGECDCQS